LFEIIAVSPVGFELEKWSVIFRPSALISPDAIKVTDRKTAPCQRPLLIAVERRQFLQQIAIRDGGHDVGPGR